MKNRYTLIDNKTGKRTHYSKTEWIVAWYIMFLFGAITGALIIVQFFVTF